MTLSAGDLRLTLPQAWRPLSTPPAVAGLESANLAARGPRADIAVTVLPPEGPTLLPKALVDEAGGIVPSPVSLQIDGRDALRYTGLSNGGMDVYAVPTTSGVVTIACVGEDPRGTRARVRRRARRGERRPCGAHPRRRPRRLRDRAAGRRRRAEPGARRRPAGSRAAEHRARPRTGVGPWPAPTATPPGACRRSPARTPAPPHRRAARPPRDGASRARRRVVPPPARRGRPGRSADPRLRDPLADTLRGWTGPTAGA